MKSKWIFIISALALFSAHQANQQSHHLGHQSDSELPEYIRGPAMVHSDAPLASPSTHPMKANNHKSLRHKSSN
jgi:hypothetical protein